MLDLTKKLKTVLMEQNITQTELARRTGQSHGNLANKLVRNDYKLSEYQRLVEALGCELELNIILPDGRKI